MPAFPAIARDEPTLGAPRSGIVTGRLAGGEQVAGRILTPPPPLARGSRR
jgi:hypothetical protein